jgi:hypothetical protein
MRWTLSAVGILAASALAAVALAASGGGDERADLTTSESAQPQDSRGYPPTPPAVATTEQSVVVVRPAPDSTISVQALSGERDAGQQDDLPFDDPIAYPAIVAADESTFYIAGVPCAAIKAVDDLGPSCAPGGLSLARYDATSRSAVPLTVKGFDQSTPYVQLLGVAGGNIVMQLGGDLYSLPADGGELTALGEPPLDNGLTFACLVGEQVVALSQSDGPGDSSPEPGEFVEEEYRPYVPFSIATLRMGEEWVTASGPDAEYDTNDTFEYGCIDRGLVAVPSEQPMLRSSPYVTHVFDATLVEWTEADPPPNEFISAAPSASDGSRVALSVSSDIGNVNTSVMIFHRETGTWTSESGGAGSEVVAMALAGDEVVTVTGDDEPVELTTIG